MLEAVRVILAHDFTLAVAEMHTHLDVAARFSAVVVMTALRGLVRLVMTGPVRFVGQDRAGSEKAGHEQGKGDVSLNRCVHGVSSHCDDNRIAHEIRPSIWPSNGRVTCLFDQGRIKPGCDHNEHDEHPTQYRKVHGQAVRPLPALYHQHAQGIDQIGQRVCPRHGP